MIELYEIEKNTKNFLRKIFNNKVYSTILIILFMGSLIAFQEYQNHINEQIKNSEKQETQNSVSQHSTYHAPSNPSQSPIPKNPEPVEIKTASEEDYQRLEQILPQNEVIQALPENAKISISFFNFNTGYREWERDYLLTKAKAVQIDSIPEDVDMKLIMHSRNVPLLKQGNLCEVIAIAKANGDFATETMISKTKLLWKYKSMMSYKECLGL